MVKETDRDMQQLYHKTCGFCDVFCGNAWCPIFDERFELKFEWLPEEDDE